MRFATVVLVTGISLCLASCSREESPQTEAASADESASLPSEQAASRPLPDASAGHDYACGDGLTINARIDRGNAIVTVEGKTLTLAPDPGASGATYSGEGATFVAMGNEAIFSRPGGSFQTCKAK